MCGGWRVSVVSREGRERMGGDERKPGVKGHRKSRCGESKEEQGRGRKGKASVESGGV